MQFLDAATVQSRLAYPALVDVLATMFKSGATAPPRHHHNVPLDARPDATYLLMPAWDRKAEGSNAAGKYIGMKSVTVFPDNGLSGLPAVQGLYLLLSAKTGEPLCVMEAKVLTTWRTAAASALASRFLSRPDASRLLMIGAGAMAPLLIKAHASVRPIRDVAIWNRSRAGAEKLVASLAGSGMTVTVADDLEQAVGTADIVSAATISATPLICGRWLKPGCHVDTVGAFRPDMRETDDDVVRRARIWVDTMAGATHEAGDIIIPMTAGIIRESDIQGDLYGLCQGRAPHRAAQDEITYFKSVGASIEDLAAAIHVYEQGQP